MIAFFIFCICIILISNQVLHATDKHTNRSRRRTKCKSRYTQCAPPHSLRNTEDAHMIWTLSTSREPRIISRSAVHRAWRPAQRRWTRARALCVYGICSSRLSNGKATYDVVAAAELPCAVRTRRHHSKLDGGGCADMLIWCAHSHIHT